MDVSTEEHLFKVQFSSKRFGTRWGTATIMGGTAKSAAAEARHGYRRLGMKVIKVIPATPSAGPSSKAQSSP